MNKVLFLGYDEKQNSLINILKKNKNLIIDHKNEIIYLDEVKKLNHYSNLRPMWGSDNIRKSNINAKIIIFDINVMSST